MIFTFVINFKKFKNKSDILMAVLCTALLFPVLVCQFFDVPNRPFLKSQDPVIKFKELNKLLSL